MYLLKDNSVVVVKLQASSVFGPGRHQVRWYEGGLMAGVLEGRKASKTWMGGEEGSYKVRIMPEVDRVEVSWIIWTGE